MKNSAVGVVRTAVIWAVLFSSGIAIWAGPRANHLFIVSIDGGKPAVIAESDMPVLKSMAAEGACTWTARTICPSLTLPSHTSMLTGVAPEKHHIYWNTWNPQAGIVQVPTIFAVARQAGFSTAMFVGKEKFRHLLQPGTVDHFDFDQTHTDKVVSTYAGASAPVTSDTVPAKNVAQRAAAWIRREKPNLCFIHFTDPDDTGHEYGWGSLRQQQAFADVDAALAQLREGIEQAGILQDSVLIITADHGGHAQTHGTQLAEDMEIPWVVWGRHVKSHYAITAPVTTFDTAATALWLLDLPCPAAFDGRPVTSAFNLEPASLTLRAAPAVASPSPHPLTPGTGG